MTTIIDSSDSTEAEGFPKIDLAVFVGAILVVTFFSAWVGHVYHDSQKAQIEKAIFQYYNTYGSAPWRMQKESPQFLPFEITPR